MEILAGIALWSGAALCLPASFLLLEVLAGFCRLRPLSASVTPRRAVLLIPAHNEALGIADTLDRLPKSGKPGLRVIVIADNCSDDTAKIARTRGVEVLERTDLSRKGKPYALEWALQRLDEDPPEVLVFLDADCWFESGGPELLAAQALEHNRPVQCIYLLEGKGLSAFAFRFRNEARLRGLQALGAPVQITGSGFAIPWAILRQVPVPLGELAEDAVWGWAFCRAGHGVALAVDTVVASAEPLSSEDASVQRRRWEHGILSAMFKHLPALFASACLPPRWRRMLHLFDVVVPPLELLAILLSISLVLGLIAGQPTALLPASLAACLLGVAVMLGWSKYGRPYLPFSDLMLAPAYAAKKLGLYLSVFFRRERNWVRTPRNKVD
jgi:cellulose synthase/poly-beta-1,6-N-acetylglucosamine synthase-like glycosyltransferase